jgi:Flp pilus assembly protein TadD, contains TPR repeats
MLSGDYNSAVIAINKALEIDPDLPEARLNLTLLFILENKIEDAINALNKAIQLGNKNHMIFFYYAILNSFSGNNVILEELLEKLESHNFLSIWLSSWEFLFSKRSKSFSLLGNRKDNIDLALPETLENGLFLEFGVGQGSSINYISNSIEKDLHGFDSFAGIPESWNHLPAGALNGRSSSRLKNKYNYS